MRHDLRWWVAGGVITCALVTSSSLADPAIGEQAVFSVRGATVPGAAAEDRQVTFDPAEPISNEEFVVTVSGWPATCASVDLDLLDGSVVGHDEGEAISSWGTIMLVAGAGSTTAVASGSEEYNLRVVGPSEQCGGPFYTPDFGFLQESPSPGAAIRAFLVPEDFEIIRVDASGWPDDCRGLEVWISGQPVSGVGYLSRVRLGELELDAGQGTLTGPASLLAELVPSFEYDVEAHTAEYDDTGDPVSGPADACRGGARAVLESPEGWAPPTTAGDDSIPSSSQAVAPSVPTTLPGTGGGEATVALLAMVITIVGAALVSVRRRSTS